MAPPPSGESSTYLTLESYLYSAIGVNDSGSDVGIVQEFIKPLLALIYLALLKGNALASPRLPQLLAGASTNEGIDDGYVHTFLL